MIAAILLSLVAGFALGAWLLGDEQANDNAVASVDSSAPIEERLLSLEQLIAEERQARLDLEDALQNLIDRIENNESADTRVITEQTVRDNEARARRSERRGARDFVAMMQNRQERRLIQLTDNGFSEDQARHILKRESEIQFEAMRELHEAQRNGEAVDRLSTASNPMAKLRAELGEADYERFLQAQDQPTSIQVMQVLSGSPANAVGMQPGDRIVRYNGERVFDVNDLRRLTMQGQAGEDVIIEVERDGVVTQLNVPRGPVGISGTGASMRSLNFWGGG